MKLNGYKHIIWDWNGTLFDDAWLCVDIINGMLGRRNLPQLSLEDYQTIFDFPVIDYYRRVGFDLSVEPFESLSDEFMGGYRQRRSECGLRAGAVETLQAVEAAGISQSILSAASSADLAQQMCQWNLGRFFAAVNGLDNHHAHGKIDIGRRWLASAGWLPEEMVLIGDTTHDFEVAQALGVDCRLIPSGHHHQDRLRTCNVPLLSTLKELGM